MKPHNPSFEYYSKHFHSLNKVKLPNFLCNVGYIMMLLIIIIITGLAITPWIQTAFGKGIVTAIHPSDRVQKITALVSGRIKKWHVKEGDTVKKGAPLVEIIDNDVNLIDRLIGERNALEFSFKAGTITAQTAKLNYDRQKKLFADGLASKLDVEKAKIEYKKYLSEQEKSRVSLRQSESKVSRQQAQYITAPRDGVILKITAGDLSTAVKSGDHLASLVPSDVEPTVALFVTGLDIALIHPGRKVRLQFEGWPSIQLSGWPEQAIGTFGGIVVSVDPVISANGKFRVLIQQDPKDHPWPSTQFLRYGARVNGWVLLEQVKLGFELWRQLNAFPPEYPEEIVANEKKANSSE